MNKAVFIFSFKKYLEWRQMLLAALALLGAAFVVGLLWGSSVGILAESARWMLFGPFVPFAVASLLVSPNVANAQQRKDGEYLSLLFTRPISRTSYVITKWLSATLFTFVIVIVLALLAGGIAWVAHRLLPADYAPFRQIVDTYALIDALGNSISFSALSVLLCSIPPRVRFYVGLVAMLMLPLFMASLGFTFLASGIQFFETHKLIDAVLQYVVGFSSITVDSYHFMNSAESPVARILTYVSNVVLYLALASWIMCRREFFYAND